MQSQNATNLSQYYRDINTDDAQTKQKNRHLTFPLEVSCDEALKHTGAGQVIEKFPRQKNGWGGSVPWSRISKRFMTIDSLEGALKWKSGGRWKFIFFEEVEQVFVLDDTDAEVNENRCRCIKWFQTKKSHNSLMFGILTFSGMLWLLAPTRHDLKLWVTAIETCKWLVMKRRLDEKIQDGFLRHVERHFRITNHTGSGYLNEKEIVTALCACNIKITNKDTKKVFARFDADNNGLIDVMEFCEMLKQFNIIETLQPYFDDYCTEPKQIISNLSAGRRDSTVSSIGSSMRPLMVADDLSSSNMSPYSRREVGSEKAEKADQGWFSNLPNAFASRFFPRQASSTTSPGSTPAVLDSLNIAPIAGTLPRIEIMEKERGFIEEFKFCLFLQKVQQEKAYTQKARQVFHTACAPSVLTEKYMTEFGFSRYICSEQNSIYDPNKSRLDSVSMNFPLTDYWIASSHNTYLEAGQLVGQSSVAQYFDVLNRGCRCVELDCWDGPGPNREPIITHGYTITKKILLRDVCRTLKRHGFTKSKFPLILSIEQHCSAEQKDKCAKIWEEEFGTALLRRQPGLSDAEAAMVTPNQAKNKFIIKAKMWNAGQHGASGSDDYARTTNLAGSTPIAHMSTDTATANGTERLDKKTREDMADAYNKCIYLVSQKWFPGREKEDHGKMGRGKNSIIVHDHTTTTDEEWKELEEAEFEEVEAKLKDRYPLSIVSLAESKLNKLVTSYRQIAYYFHSKFLSRVYPAGTRIKSSNVNPMVAWSTGSQMVALNYQTFDKETLKNEGRFRYPNGGCGYVLKPKVLRELSVSRFASCAPMTLEITILSGHGLPKPKRSMTGPIVSPSCVVSLHNAEHADKEFRTDVVNSNGFNPVFGSTFKMGEIRYPELAIITFEVHNNSIAGETEILAGAAFPLDGLLQGLRWIPLFDSKFTTLHHCGLLAGVKMEDAERVECNQFFVCSNMHELTLNGTYVWNKLWCCSKPVYQKESKLPSVFKRPFSKKKKTECEARPVYQKDSVSEKPLYLFYNVDKSKETTGWVIGPEPFEKLTYYAIARCPDAKTPDQINCAWELIREPPSGEADLPHHSTDFQIILNDFQYNESTNDTRQVRTRNEILQTLLLNSNASMPTPTPEPPEPPEPPESQAEALRKGERRSERATTGAMIPSKSRALDADQERRASVSPTARKSRVKSSSSEKTTTATPVSPMRRSTKKNDDTENNSPSSPGIFDIITDFFRPSSSSPKNRTKRRSATDPPSPKSASSQVALVPPPEKQVSSSDLDGGRQRVRALVEKLNRKSVSSSKIDRL